jgi:peptidoglycan/xylan/chitin deacetylase (PgdA/CDA1 family)
VEWLRERPHDVLGHGYRWYGPDVQPGRPSRDEERAEIERAVASLQATTGERVQGWMVRSFPTPNTRELLVEEGGFLYDSDSTNDELPYFVPVLGRRHLVVPYTKVFNDTRYLINPTYAAPRHFLENLRAGLEYMLGEAARGHGGRLLSVGVHPRWSGQANRASAVRDFVELVLETPRAGFMRRLDVARHWLATHG